ncbi:T9SS type A sorting domain-containing protein [Lewinella sp. W8]|uniref:T9SS type A sorting domain-containing protein n=1 Tax=Lewinella sp. W8 TaxID=2528208 RepID=UPI0010675A87|nr:T9SS type A sorting domain-containing protein [Lewinella sp. W8]MTB52185.1 T9SS type A sorting domain-containing protein [Lewinella sp. W8]
MMKNSILHTCLLLVFFLLGASDRASAQCDGCNVMVCDGNACDDGSPADGVQTSRNCGCGQEIRGACAYVEIDMTLNPYFDPNDPSCSLIFSTQESGNFSIYLLEAGCDLTDCGNPDFVITGGGAISGFPSSGQFEVMVCKNGGNAGRRDFSFGVSCSSVENCLNAIDDNLDGFIDCDDADCSLDTNCSAQYTTTSSGEDGGLESNRRLSQKIARRNYQRSRNASPRAINVNERLFERDHERLKRGVVTKSNDFSLADFIPEGAIAETQTYVSTPDDIVDITNAVEVLSVDVFRRDLRVGSVFATKSTDGVYEHTKLVCDRLHGASIDAVWEHPIGGDEKYLITRFSRADGTVEYATNFSFFRYADGSFQVESHWNLSDYTPDMTYGNFQLWSNNLANLEALVMELKELLMEQGNVKAFRFSEAPRVLIKRMDYLGEELRLKVLNRSGAKELILSGEYLPTETEQPNWMFETIALSGREQETVTVPINGLYNAGLKVSTDVVDVVYDGIFVADGTWAVDYPVGGAMIYDYEVSPGKTSWEEGEFTVERNVHLMGQLRDYVNVYRSFNPAFSSVDLSAFNELSFRASGVGDLTVTLVRAGIQDWDKQMKTRVRLEPDARDISLPLRAFSAGETAELDWSDVTMIVFTQEGNGQDRQQLLLNIEEATFSHKEERFFELMEMGSEESWVFPNPMEAQGSLFFQANTAGTYHFQLIDPRGRVLQSKTGACAAGNHQILLQNDDYLPGVYYYRVSLSDGNLLSGKIMMSAAR